MSIDNKHYNHYLEKMLLENKNYFIKTETDLSELKSVNKNKSDGSIILDKSISTVPSDILSETLLNIENQCVIHFILNLKDKTNDRLYFIIYNDADNKKTLEIHLISNLIIKENIDEIEFSDLIKLIHKNIVADVWKNVNFKISFIKSFDHYLAENYYTKYLADEFMIGLFPNNILISRASFISKVTGFCGSDVMAISTDESELKNLIEEANKLECNDFKIESKMKRSVLIHNGIEKRSAGNTLWIILGWFLLLISSTTASYCNLNGNFVCSNFNNCTGINAYVPVSVPFTQTLDYTCTEVEELIYEAYDYETANLSLIYYNQTYYDCYLGGFQSDSCMQSCIFAVNISGCDGDTGYCEVYNCTFGAQCYCNTRTAVIILYPLDTQFLEVGLYLANDTNPILQTNSINTATLFISVNDVLANSYKNQITLTSITDDQLTCNVMKDLWEYSLTLINKTQVMVVVPIEYMTADGYAFIVCTDKVGNQRAFLQVFLNAMFMCTSSNCFLCKEVIEDFWCMSRSAKFSFVASWLGFLIALLIVFFGGWWLLLALFKITGTLNPFIIFKYIWNMKIFVVMRRSIRWILSYFCGCLRPEKATEEMEALKETSIINGGGGTTRRKLEILPLFAILLILLPVLLAERTCDNGVSIETTVTNCVYNNTLKTCNTILASHTLSLVPYQGTCYSIYDQDHRFILDITIQHQLSGFFFPLETQYFTANWQSALDAIRHCPTVGFCKKGFFDGVSRCEFSGSADTNDLLDDTVKIWPGVTSCVNNAPSGWGDHCFYSVGSCIKSRWAIVPEGDIYQVYKLITPVYFTSYILALRDARGDANSDLIISHLFQKTFKYKFNNFDINIINSLPGIIPSPPRTHFYNVGDEYGFVDACEVNAQLKGKFGDIQSPNANNLLTPGKVNFNFPTDAITTRLNKLQVIWEGYEPGVKLDKTRLKLPLTASGAVWYYNTTKNELVAQVFDVNSVVTVSTAEIVSITYITNEVCPLVTISDVNGCHDCSDGFSVRIQAKSSCSPGMVLIESEDKGILLFTNSISLTQALDEYIIIGHTTYKNNDFILKFRGTTSIDVQIKFTASTVTKTNNQTQINYGTKDTDRNNNIDWEFSCSIWLCTSCVWCWDSWYVWLIWAIILVFVIIIIKIIYRTFVSRKLKNY